MLILKMTKMLHRVGNYHAQGYTVHDGTGIWFHYLREFTNFEYLPLKKKMFFFLKFNKMVEKKEKALRNHVVWCNYSQNL